MTRPLHFTIGTGLGLNPSVGQLSLENDLLMVKAGLLYADRVRLCSIGASLALEFAKLMKASGRERMEFLAKYFEDLAPGNPEAAASFWREGGLGRFDARGGGRHHPPPSGPPGGGRCRRDPGEDRRRPPTPSCASVAR